jgi:hypothetical protein
VEYKHNKHFKVSIIRINSFYAKKEYEIVLSEETKTRAKYFSDRTVEEGNPFFIGFLSKDYDSQEWEYNIRNFPLGFYERGKVKDKPIHMPWKALAEIIYYTIYRCRREKYTYKETVAYVDAIRKNISSKIELRLVKLLNPLDDKLYEKLLYMHGKNIRVPRANEENTNKLPIQFYTRDFSSIFSFGMVGQEILDHRNLIFKNSDRNGIIYKMNEKEFMLLINRLSVKLFFSHDGTGKYHLKDNHFFSLRFDNVQDLEACLDKYWEEIYDSDRKVTFIIGDH